MAYEKASANGSISVPNFSEFQNGHRVVNKGSKPPEKRVTLSRFAQFFNRYGIYKVVPGESSRPKGSEYVWQRGVGV